ncbi:hypothetical protein BH11PLA2_BH11PLA2_26780 [soil metagenome]
MNLRRILPAAALTAGIALTAGAQTPAGGDEKTKPAVPVTGAPVVPPVSTPPAPEANPDFKKAGEELGKGNVDKALEHLKAACEKDKNLAPPKVILSQIYAQVANQGGSNAQQAAQAARIFLEQAAAEDPDHPDPILLSGAYALGESRLVDAMLCFETALAKSGSARWLTDQRKRFVKSSREGLAQVYSNRRDFKQALEQLRALLADDPKNGKLRVQAANLTFLFGQPDAAFADLKQAFADDPSVDLPEVMMARFWDSKPNKAAGEDAKAEEWFNKAIAAAPKDVKAPREFARWLLNQNRLADADAKLADAAKVDANDKETKALKGLSHRYKKEYKEAETIFDELNRADRTNPFYAWNLAIILAESPEKSKQEQAVAIATLVQSSQPKSPEAVSVLAWCLFKAGRLDDAEKAIGIAAQASQGNFPPDTIYYAARILEKKGKGKEARDNLQKALDAKAPFVYRKDAEEFQKQLIKDHGPVTKEEKKDDKKDEKKPEEPKKNP